MSKIEIRQLTKTISKTAISLLLVFVWGLTGAHAQSRLTPISGAVYWGKGMLNNYDTEINRLLLPSSYRFAYIVEPSFSTEYCLVGDDNNLILKKAEQKVWSVINTASIKVIDNDSIVEIKPNDKPQKVSIKEYQLQISPTIVDSISNLIESAVLTSSYFSDALGCDGTTFVFISWPYTAKCWSPTKDSNCKRLVALADSICKAVELNDSMLIKRNLNKISELHQTFKALYIEKPSEEYPYLLDNPDGEYKHFRGNHFVAYLVITFLFFIIVGIVGSIIILCSKKRRKYWWMPLLAAILLCVVLYAIAYFYMTLNSISW